MGRISCEQYAVAAKNTEHQGGSNRILGPPAGANCGWPGSFHMARIIPLSFLATSRGRNKTAFFRAPNTTKFLGRASENVASRARPASMIRESNISFAVSAVWFARMTGHDLNRGTAR